jgi:hypothetical protein
MAGPKLFVITEFGFEFNQTGFFIIFKLSCAAKLFMKKISVQQGQKG